ncbi:hypothetical protein MKW94_025147 [Papaver nudicaule]|uniref:Uncharacterized protein n=1 Tax=Papaver nudicaule TaxID=74823 RepID=A0AA41VXM8_PAPNU|nr:hypothetical protein [Papaver nudicaule]
MIYKKFDLILVVNPKTDGHGSISTTVPSDPYTHDDFKPTNKAASSGISLKDIVEKVLDYRIPMQPRCGCSSLNVRLLNEYNVRVGARNILEDQEMKNVMVVYLMNLYIVGDDIIKHKQMLELRMKLRGYITDCGKW